MDERDKKMGRAFLRSKFAKSIPEERRRLYKSAWVKGK